MSSTEFSNDPGAPQGSSGNGSSSDPASARDRAEQTAGTARDETQRVAGVAKDEAARVTGEAGTQIRGLLDEASTQVDEQSKAQKARLAEIVRTFGDDLSSMTARTEDSSGVAAQVVQQVGDQARTLAAHLEDREPRELLDDVRGFARRKPGTFLLGALAAGVLVGRLTRGAKDAPDHGLTADEPRHEVAQPTPALAGEESTGQPDADLARDLSVQTNLGAKGVEMSESGAIGPGGGRA